MRPSTVVVDVVCNIMYCIVAKRCVLEQKLLLAAYRKSYMGNRLVAKWWPWPLFRGPLTSCQPLRHIRHWISQKPLEIEAWFQKTTNRKWPMWNHMVTWPMTLRNPERSSRDPSTLKAQYLENSWRCYLAKIAKLLDCLLWGSTVGYFSNSLASCPTLWRNIMPRKHVIDLVFLR